MADWQAYSEVFAETEHAGENPVQHTVTGDVRVLRDVYSPQLANRRDVFVYLPPGYDDGGARYPVIYMHDGQNLFDAATSFVGEWGVDETLDALSADGIAAIVVGLPNIDGRITGGRLAEYGPFPSARFTITPRSDDYLAFICETIKPLVDADFRTLPDRAHTGIMGSSMGGLISLYAFFARAAVFGFAGIMSPAFWFTANDAIFTYVAAQPRQPGRLYIDVGTREAEDDLLEEEEPDPPLVNAPFHLTSAVYVEDARRMRDLLLAKGYRDGEDLLYVEEEGAIHHETAWARRLPGALRFLLRSG